jgi:hypothetical protein
MVCHQITPFLNFVDTYHLGLCNTKLFSSIQQILIPQQHHIIKFLSRPKWIATPSKWINNKNASTQIISENRCAVHEAVALNLCMENRYPSSNFENWGPVLTKFKWIGNVVVILIVKYFRHGNLTNFVRAIYQNGWYEQIHENSQYPAKVPEHPAPIMSNRPCSFENSFSFMDCVTLSCHGIDDLCAKENASLCSFAPDLDNLVLENYELFFWVAQMNVFSFPTCPKKLVLDENISIRFIHDFYLGDCFPYNTIPGYLDMGLYQTLLKNGRLDIFKACFDHQTNLWMNGIENLEKLVCMSFESGSIIALKHIHQKIIDQTQFCRNGALDKIVVTIKGRVEYENLQ